MKRTILFSSALVALAMLASCQKEEFIETPVNATGVTEFTATIEPPTKTAVDGDGKVTWTAGDVITVTDAASKSAVYVAASDGASTTFTLKQGETAVGAGPYTATYGDITKQVYSASGANCPLSASTSDTSTKNLQFSSPYAVVKITAKSSGAEVIKTVAVKYGDKIFTLDCGDGVELTSEGKDFYVAVEPAEAEMSVTFYTADKMTQKTRKSAVSLAAKDLLPVTFSLSVWDTPTFKAVYNTTGDANTLTFYYDAVDHGGEGIAVYEGSTGDYYLFDGTKSGANLWGYNQNNKNKGVVPNIKSVVIDASVAGYSGLTSTSYMFQGMTAATTITGAEYLDVSNVTNMSLMFQNFGGGKNDSHTTLNSVPDVSNWNTSNVTNMQGMFNSYGNFSDDLTKVPDVSGWKTGNVTNLGSMFLDYGGLNTGGTTTVESNVEFTLDLSGWNLTKLTNGGSVFDLKPKTFNVTIPAKTGEQDNDATHWYYGNGTDYIIPPASKNFTLSL